MEPTHDRFSGDLKVLTRLVEKEHEAHTALGDVAGLMGEHDVKAEEDRIRDVLAGRKQLDDVVKEVGQVQQGNDLAALFARMQSLPAEEEAPETTETTTLYADRADYLREALVEVYSEPQQPLSALGGGVNWREYATDQIVQMSPPSDLRKRLNVLPQSYLRDRQVTETFKLATTKTKGETLRRNALADESGSSWPEAHFLGPLHPILEWVSDRALAHLGRNQVFAVRGDVDAPTVLLLGSLTNRSGHTVTSSWLAVEFPTGQPSFALVAQHRTAEELLDSVGIKRGISNPGPIADASALNALMPAAVAQADEALKPAFAAARQQAEAHVAAGGSARRPGANRQMPSASASTCAIVERPLRKSNNWPMSDHRIALYPPAPRRRPPQPPGSGGLTWPAMMPSSLAKIGSASTTSPVKLATSPSMAGSLLAAKPGTPKKPRPPVLASPQAAPTWSVGWVA
ncbi:hypothetical protein [Ornithinimicrobium sp. INDO-MA30-4]|uniref:hypothetical protein n=1 Tax=Ornithinimicrobium sp. INDO-MA30-4 TaxID=2908651 RepID=UPI001F35A3BE|nr:hypothetical protein [Ornithinimicrobium sp. INDO-MA30-4]UJH69567.1 hypothetical protein L0A91_09320 [Ornithinimicrobium sp. INDO-MA30-4]